MSKVLFLVNHDMSLYTFRLEIIKKFLEEGHEVHIASPKGEYIDKISQLGTIYHETKVDRRGTSIGKDFKLLKQYKILLKTVKPDIVFGYTVKPNIYGAIVARYFKIPFVANITGLGTALEYPGVLQKILVTLYKFAFCDIRKVFFQNQENQSFFLEKGIIKKNYDLLPGSGVNLNKFAFREYPQNTSVKVAFISRIMKEKGIDEFLIAAEEISSKYRNVEFHICGFCEPEYTGNLEAAQKKGIIKYHGLIDDVESFLKDINVVVHPTYYPEGMSNVLLEACATGRPIITTKRSGCKEIVDDNKNGFFVKERDANSLIAALEVFLNLTTEEKAQMGAYARMKVEREFDRDIVVKKYLHEVNLLNELKE